MKKTSIHILLAVLVVLAGSSCQKHFLDNAPLTQYSDDNVWQDSSLISRFVDNLYGNIISNYDFVGSGLLASITDESKVNRLSSGYPTNQVNSGQYTSGSNLYDQYWEGAGQAPTGV